MKPKVKCSLLRVTTLIDFSVASFPSSLSASNLFSLSLRPYSLAIDQLQHASTLHYRLRYINAAKTYMFPTLYFKTIQPNTQPTFLCKLSSEPVF